MRKTLKLSRGFTIVETMIVLAVTGVIFISVALLINGKQNAAEFQSSIHDAVAQIQQVINETASGYYPTTGYSCSSASGIPSFTGVTNDHSCVFVGKALHFYDGTGGTKSDTFDVYSLAGLKTLLTVAPNSTWIPFDRALPQVMANNSGPLIDTHQFGYGLHAVSMRPNGTSSSIGTFIVAQSLAYDLSINTNPPVGSNTSNAQNLHLVIPKSSSLKQNSATAASVINQTFTGTGVRNKYWDSSAPSNSNVATDVTICLASGTTNQAGLITVDASLNVNLKIFPNGTCT